jgi:hypothetical protein
MIEALAAEAYRHDRLTKPELQRLLGIETTFEVDSFMKTHDLRMDDAEPAESSRKGNILEQGLGLFGSPDDAALLDEVVSLAYEERRCPTRPAPAF